MKTSAIVLSSAEVANLLGITKRAVIYACQQGAYGDVMLTDCNGGAGYLIPLATIPAVGQARYWSNRAGQEVDLDELPTEQAESLWKRYEAATPKLRERAQASLAALLEMERLQRQGQPMTGPDGILEHIREEFGISKSALYLARKATDAYPRSCWAPLLVPDYDGKNAKTTDFPPAAWYYFLKHVRNPGARIKTAWKKTLREAKKQNWGAIPSYDTAMKLWKAIPEDTRAYMRGEETAVKRLSPSLRRDRTTLAINELWSTDSRILDYWVIDAHGDLGQKGRPPFRLWMTAYVEARSSLLIGYALGIDLNADLVQAAFLNALDTSGLIIPQDIQHDNGRENFAKIISGGAENRGFRERSATKENDIVGLYPMLDIGCEWAQPANGQAKIVERVFGTLSLMHDRMLGDFPGAYCGHSPDNRPENCDPAKAVPLRAARQLLQEDINAYNRQPSTGQGMGGKSPLQIYSELMEHEVTKCRRITTAQRRMCALSATDITIRKDGGFSILGSQYRDLQTVKLAPGKGYYARFNPNDLQEPVHVYQGTKLVAQDVKAISLTPYRSKEDAKRIGKEKTAYRRSLKASAAAFDSMSKTASDAYISQLATDLPDMQPDTPPGGPLPSAKVLEMVQNQVQVPQTIKQPAEPKSQEPDASPLKADIEKVRAARRQERNQFRTAWGGR